MTEQLREQVELGASPASDTVAPLLLEWYVRHHRKLPWRAQPGKTNNPYHVWLSEVMLQQTTVATVKDYFVKFLDKWPTVFDLAAADQEEVLAAWAGLGYYARARNLHKCAQHVASELDGVFPSEEAELLKLPGVGPYTAAAVSAIAFQQSSTILDGNVERVVSRLFRVEQPLPPAKETLRSLAQTLTPLERGGDYAQAIMDLGATICTPTKPKCFICPIREMCAGQNVGDMESFPRKLPKPEKPVRNATGYILISGDKIYLRKRPQKGLLAGMLEVPSTDWQEASVTPEMIENAKPTQAEWHLLSGQVRHTFTHFKLVMPVMLAALSDDDAVRQDLCSQDEAGRWVELSDLDEQALPTVMRKAIAIGMKQLAAVIG